MEVNFFRNFKSKTPESSTLEAVVEQIRSDQSLARLTALYRQDESKQLKEESPLFAVAATFSGGNGKADIATMTGLSLVDFDHVGEDRLEAIREKVIADPHTLLYYITKDGTVYPGRPESEPGAHALRYNAHSIGVCYEGGLDADGRPADTRTPAQKLAMRKLLESLCLDYPDAAILGHRDLPWVRKACPCFDVAEWLEDIHFSI